MTGREAAWRVLAHEFTSSLEEERGTGDRAASYVISPLGARMNRVAVVGTMGAPETLGRDEEAPFYRGRLTDPTGALTVTAGGFQPRAMAALKALAEPRPVLVVGKAHLYRGRDQTVHGSVRAEAIRPISEEEYRAALVESIGQTADRLDLVRAYRGGTGPTEAEVRARATPPLWVRGAQAAAQRYPTVDLEPFRAALARALDVAEGRGGVRPDPEPVSPRVRIQRTPAAPPPAPAARSAAERAEEAAFLDLIDELADASADGYADLREALGRAAARGVHEAKAEELVNRLEEAGVLEEPIVGKLRRA